MATTEDGPEGGGVGSRSGDFTAVRLTPVAVGVAVLTALFVLAAYMSAPLPRLVARVFHVDESAFAKEGGLELKWAPPAGFDDTKLDRVEKSLRARANATGGFVSRDGDAYVIAIPGVLRAEVDFTVARIAGDGTPGEGLTFREVLQVDAMKELLDFNPALREGFSSHAKPDPRTVHYEVDQWRADEAPAGGEPVTDYYVFGPTRAQLEAIFADAQTHGWKLPQGARIAYEHIEPFDEVPGGYRSYVVRDEPDLDGSSVAMATATFDPNTNRPTVLLDFNRDGTQRFGEVTAKIVGKKLAILVNGEVKSAPIINGAIRGGRASIAMGTGDPARAQLEADDLVRTLNQGGSLPQGGRVLEKRYVPPSDDATRVWIARLVLALVGGALVGLLAWLVLRWAAPVVRKRRAAFAGALPWPRLLVLLVAPASILLVSRIPIYGLSQPDNRGFASMFQNEPTLRIGALGIMPVITGAIIVELVALAVPGWRRRRHAGPIGRFPITLAAAVTAVLLIVIQGWSLAMSLGSIEGMLAPGLMPKILVVGSVAGGTLILIAAAAIVRMYGLGNGYGALFASGWLIGTLHLLRGGALVSSLHVFSGLVIITIAAAFAVVLRWRVQRDGELGLRLPVSSIAPLSDAGGLIAFLVLLSQFSFDEVMYKLMDWISHLREHPFMLLGLVIVLAIVWSLAFGRPSPYAGLARPSWPVWLRATVLSVVVLAFVALIVALTAEVRPGAIRFAEPISIGVAVAFVLDAYADFAARRTKLVTVWTLHQPHHADAAERALADAGIPSHMSAGNLRALLAFFGPFVPIEVQVAPDHALAARAKLEELAGVLGV